MSVASVKSSEGASSSACGHDEQNCAPESSDRHDQESNKPELLKRKRQLQGGFECVFVEGPPKQVQTECAICLCVLKDPYLVDCCCNSFCQSCINPIQEDGKPCPLCNTKFTTCIPDKRLQRTLNEMKVYCPHKESGCQWTDELLKLSQHLNLGGSEEFKGCLFVLIECTFCHENIQRKELKEHKAAKCPQRPYSCDYCNSYKSTCEDVTTNHWPICPFRRPVPCPNQCGVYPEYKQLDEHLAKQCALAVIKCPFEYAGCTCELQRIDMEVHLSEKLAYHMSLQAISHKLQFEAYQNQVIQLKQQVETLTMENEQLAKERKKSHDHVTQLKLSIERLYEENQQLRRQIEQHGVEIADLRRHTTYQSYHDVKSELASCKTDMMILHTHLGLLPVEVTLREFGKSRRDNVKWFSNPFYTHTHGYKLCLVVHPNGRGDGSDTHVSVYVRLMQGEFDDELDWPFIGNIIIELLPNHQQASAPSGTLRPTIYSIGITDKYNGRVIGKERADGGRGYTKFVSHTDVEQQYLKDDTLIFKVSKE